MLSEDPLSRARAGEENAFRELVDPYPVRYLEEIRDLLIEAWTTRGGARARLRRAIGHALEFRTWQSLVRRQGCRTNEAAQLMLAFVCAAASADGGAMKVRP